MMKTILSLAFLLASASAQSVNETLNCEDQLEVINAQPDVESAWGRITTLMLDNCNHDDDSTGCDEDKTGSQIIHTFYFDNIDGSNETKDYDEACANVPGEITRVKTISDEPVIVACTAKSSSHIPYEVHLEDYFQCTGLACDDTDEAFYDAAVKFAIQVIDQNQNEVSCELGPHDGASALTASVSFVLATAAALFALF